MFLAIKDMRTQAKLGKCELAKFVLKPKVLRRYCREFSLPHKLPRIIVSCLKYTTDLLSVRQDFSEGCDQPRGSKYTEHDIKSVDLR